MLRHNCTRRSRSRVILQFDTVSSTIFMCHFRCFRLAEDEASQSLFSGSLPQIRNHCLVRMELSFFSLQSPETIYL